MSSLFDITFPLSFAFSNPIFVSSHNPRRRNNEFRMWIPPQLVELLSAVNSAPFHCPSKDSCNHSWITQHRENIKLPTFSSRNAHPRTLNPSSISTPRLTYHILDAPWVESRVQVQVPKRANPGDVVVFVSICVFVSHMGTK